MKNEYRILVIEDDLIVAENIRECLVKYGFPAPHVLDNYAEAVYLVKTSQFSPNLVICDIRIRGEKNGIELARKLKEFISCDLVFLSAYNDSLTLSQAFDLQPEMFLVKPYTEQQFITAVELTYAKFTSGNACSPVKLTKREAQIVNLIRSGLMSKEIAEKLSISVETVNTHRRKILAKNKVKNFSELTHLLGSKG
ncbi:MAG: response regulator [Bacteroidota bacterium]